MKETKFDKFIGTYLREVPITVWLIAATILNYILGSTAAAINESYSEVQNMTKEQFFCTIIKLICAWAIIKLLNQSVAKISRHKMLNSNYMKWIKKLTYSKLASISNISTGVANDAIHTIAACDKGMVDCFLAMIPNVVPFYMLCKKEYNIAGIIPVIVNFSCIIVFTIVEFKFSNASGYKKQAKARAMMSAVTIDCIKNSQTVKYFNREDWSIGKQEDMQKRTFAWQIALPINSANCLFGSIMWLPTILSIWMCWESTSTVIYIAMMSYIINNLISCASGAFESYTEKKNQLQILGKLQNDNTIKDNIKESIKIKNIEFSYNPDNSSSVKFKIDNLELVKGHRYCITGRSGFGKSTLAKILTGTFAPTKGNIPIVKSVYMFAESEMFNTTIVENITLGEQYSKSEIEEMLNAFEISVDIDPFSDPVGENGSLLSTGQKQRINLCRTLFYARRHRDSLIVMDEVTAALDIKTSITCLEYLTAEFKRLGTTLVYISNKTDYLEVDLITDDIYVHRTGNVVTYDTVPED